jgi:penicillin-binding protein 1C
VRSTLDARVQRLALAALREQLAELGGRQVEDGAIVVLDNRTGEVLAWVGSSGSAFSDAPQVDGVLARRQPGSTLKPFVYQLALERRLLTAASRLDDSPAQLDTGGGLYVPQNYDRRFRGPVSTRQALAGSLNVPAVRAAALLPPDALLQRLNALGLALPHTGGFYGASLALGSGEVTLLALTNAYRALANGGAFTPARWDGGPAPPPRAVADRASSFIVGDILADNAARAASFGLDSALALPGWAAVKTGTSKDLRDNWCIGYSTRVTVGVWVGNASGAPMHDVSGVSGAAPVWRRLMLALHAGSGWAEPAPPAGLARTRVLQADGREPPRDEWFLPGTEMSLVVPVAATASGRATAQTHFGIAHPRDGSVFALDPDIPPSAQRLVFEGERGLWRLNGRPLGAGTPSARHSWPLWPGRHRLEWVSADGQTRQTVRFEVRGATLKRGAKGPP